MRPFHYCEGGFHFGNVAAWCNNLPVPRPRHPRRVNPFAPKRFTACIPSNRAYAWRPARFLDWRSCDGNQQKH